MPNQVLGGIMEIPGFICVIYSHYLTMIVDNVQGSAHLLGGTGKSG